jgi:hypothetical protein
MPTDDAVVELSRDVCCFTAPRSRLVTQLTSFTVRLPANFLSFINLHAGL